MMLIVSPLLAHAGREPCDDEEGEGQEWRRGRVRTKSKPKQPRPTSVCAALAEKERPIVPGMAADM